MILRKSRGAGDGSDFRPGYNGLIHGLNYDKPFLILAFGTCQSRCGTGFLETIVEEKVITFAMVAI